MDVYVLSITLINLIRPVLGTPLPILVQRLNTVKTKSTFGECYTCFGYETKMVVVRILVILQYTRRLMFSHINGKLSSRPFQ